jgi:hypothetical protein
MGLGKISSIGPLLLTKKENQYAFGAKRPSQRSLAESVVKI